MEKIIAFAKSSMEDYLEIKEIRESADFEHFSGTRYIVTFKEGYWWESNHDNETHEYTVLPRAWDMFKTILRKFEFKTVNLCEKFVETYEDVLDPDYHYIPSSTAGDYSPSNPWDAPGMSIHDFI